MLERQREGVAQAKAEGKYRGRAPTARAKAAEVSRSSLVTTSVSSSTSARISRVSIFKAHTLVNWSRSIFIAAAVD
jgi:DNA invertase Pin-like site-specific DNA recombinase